MDVICYGLSLPLSDHETIKDCVNVYCEWLTALHPQPKLSVPGPVLDDANVYARKIISHLHNLFTPRQGESKYDKQELNDDACLGFLLANQSMINKRFTIYFSSLAIFI